MNAESNMFTFKRLTSLKDVLLKQIVFNFPKIFLYKDPKNETVKLNRKVRLPQKLFESIQITSHEIGWPILMKYLKPCLLNRERLRVTSVNLSAVRFTEEDFIDICKSEGPITHLKIRGIRFTDSMVDALEKHSHHLEFLKISAHKRLPEKSGTSIFGKSPLRFPKLRKLHVDCITMEIRHFFRIDFPSCSETLESLELMNFSIFESEELALKFMESWKSLKFLTNLKVDRFHLYPEMGEVVSQLKNLRSLRISMSGVKNPSVHLSRMMHGLPQLRHFSILDNFRRNDMEWFRNKKLNYLGFQSDQDPSDYKHASETALKCGLSDTLDNFITFYEYCGKDFRLYSWKIRERFMKESKEKNLAHFRQRMEKLIVRSICSGINEQNDWSHMSDYLDFLSETESLFTFSSDFLMKLANFVISFSYHKKNMKDIEHFYPKYNKVKQLDRFMLNYVILNPRAVISSFYLRYLVIEWKSRMLANTIIEVENLKRLECSSF